MKKMRTIKPKETLAKRPVASLDEQYPELLWLRQQIKLAATIDEQVPLRRTAQPALRRSLRTLATS